MFAYCRSNPVIRKDATGTDDICVTTDDDNPFDDLGIPGMGSGGGGGGGSFGQCGWSTFVNTMQSAANGLSMAMGQRNVAYAATRTPVTVYRSVSSAEAQDIRNTGRFNLVPGGMESKQFGFDLVETQKFGAMMGQNIIVCVDVPTSMLGELYTGGVDTSIFRSGTLTVYDNQLDAFNQAVQGTIKFVP